jgi:hypothetical protein
MKIRTLLTGTAVSAAMAIGMASSAQAALVTVYASIDAGNSGNDCSGVFGIAPTCNVEGPDDADGITLFSPLIVKYDLADDGTETARTLNPAYSPPFTGDEIEFDGDSWEYTPGAGDPGIRYWVAKGGNDPSAPKDEPKKFNLFWTVDEAETLDGGACFGAVYTDACLEKALVVTSGEFFTFAGGLSHLSFYDTEGVVPLPAAAWLLLSGLLGLGALGRRKASA